MDSLPALPLEVIIHILKFVSLSDRKQARLVCRQWYYASQDPFFLHQELVEIQHNSQMLDLINSSRTFQHFILKGSDINWKLKDFWDQNGPCLRSISLVSCDVHERDFVNLLSCCSRLESLRLSGCRELLMSGRLLSDEKDILFLKSILLSLKDLSIEDNSYLSDELFNRFVALCPHLESLSLNGCQVSFHQGLCKKFYPNLENNDSTLASSTILTFRNILNYVCRNTQRVRKLSFSKTIIDSQAIAQLAQVEKLHLEHVQLSRCEQLTNAGVIALAQVQPRLLHLDLSFSSRVTDAALISICQNLRQLRLLNLRSCAALTDLGIVEIHKLAQLEYLDLSSCSQVSGAGILGGVCVPCHEANLRKLFLSGMNNMTPDVVIRLAQSLPNLTHLDLSYCFTAVTDASIQAIFQHQIWLRCLEVNGCDNITDAGLTGMGMGTRSSAAAQGPEGTAGAGAEAAADLDLDTQLDEAPLQPAGQPAWPKISLRSRAEEEIVRDARRKKAVLQLCKDDSLSGKQTGFSLARLKGLTCLCLRGCSRISDVSLYYAFQFLELKVLDLTQCHQVTHVGLRSISENNPSIEYLYLNQCLSVTDDAVQIIAQNLRRLRALGLQGCEKLSVQSVRHVQQYCSNLRRLDMLHCKGLDGAAAARISLENVTDLRLPGNFSDAFPTPVPPPMPGPRAR